MRRNLDPLRTGVAVILATVLPCVVPAVAQQPDPPGHTAPWPIRFSTLAMRVGLVQLQITCGNGLPVDTPREEAQRAPLGRVAMASREGTTAHRPPQPVRLRPPSVPLVAHDPYFSIWSPADKLTDADTVHWTGKAHRLTSLVRIDGRPFRLMGTTPRNVPALPQTGLEVLPTRTVYTFEGEGVQIVLAFTTPALPEDLGVLSRPATYLTWTVRACQTTGGQCIDVGILKEGL